MFDAVQEKSGSACSTGCIINVIPEHRENELAYERPVCRVLHRHTTHVYCLTSRVSYKAVKWKLEVFFVEQCVYFQYLTNSTPHGKKCRE